jgi:hypothetical protein
MPGNFPKSNVPSEIGGALDKKVLSMPSNKNLMQATELFLY